MAYPVTTFQGHSAWGQFSLVGRVRPCDGFISLCKEYVSFDHLLFVNSSNDPDQRSMAIGESGYIEDTLWERLTETLLVVGEIR